MRFAALSLAYVFALVSVVQSQPPTASGPPVVIVPPTPPEPPVEWEAIKGDTKTGSDITLSIGAKAKWRLIDNNTGATLRISQDGKSATIRNDRAGAVRFVVTTDGGEPRFCVVNIGDSPNPPDPKPPNPPGPTPPSPLRERIWNVFNSDTTTPNKLECAKNLAAIYRAAAVVAVNPEVATTGELIRRVREASAIVLKPNELASVRSQVAIELGVHIGADEPLSDQQRADVSKLFRELAVILDSFQ